MMIRRLIQESPQKWIVAYGKQSPLLYEENINERLYKVQADRRVQVAYQI